ncbi:unnamed protein product [Tuber melanosporum]|uniref:(Perigord truffle) hypothetical protein n=1 Tax=Tuber melanosporum (strain Mel28) TaxID=656061 RepID=D5GHE7_TUBMM|nr:uncharacterized protein GSTUM_00007838001 [Tuber melanosporum]CAZ83940.1 unnamed protein product [Tuber melanosporum]
MVTTFETAVISNATQKTPIARGQLSGKWGSILLSFHQSPHISTLASSRLALLVASALIGPFDSPVAYCFRLMHYFPPWVR